MNTTQDISPKSGLTTFILCFFFGFLGIHRFYVGKIGTGILMLLTMGGLGFWVLYDLFSIVCKNFTDAQNRPVLIAQNPTAPRNVTIVVLVIYILLFGSITVIVGMATRGLATAGNNELTALRQGNIEQAYSYTSSEFKKGVNLDTFKTFVASYPQLHDNVSSTFNDIEYKDNNGSISGNLNMKDGTAVAVEIDLLKENSQWMINGINVNKTSTQETVPATAPEATPAPVQGANPAPAQPADQTPAQGANPAAAQPADQVPAQGANPTPAQPAGQAPAQGSNAVPAQPADEAPDNSGDNSN